MHELSYLEYKTVVPVGKRQILPRNSSFIAASHVVIARMEEMDLGETRSIDAEQSSGVAMVNGSHILQQESKRYIEIYGRKCRKKMPNGI